MDTIEESVDMSNLGGYQKLTTFAKKVGGPGNLVVLIAGSGVAVGAIAVKAGEFMLYILLLLKKRTRSRNCI